MKVAIGIALIVVIVAGVFLVLRIGAKPSSPTPTAPESEILDLFREVYGDNITNEQLVRADGDLLLHAELQNENVREIQINLTNLARKHEEEGVSLPVLKMGMRFD